MKRFTLISFIDPLEFLFFIYIYGDKGVGTSNQMKLSAVFGAMKRNLNLLVLCWVTLMFGSLLESSAQDFDFFYFVQQWPGSYCDTKSSCCYPKWGKPDADFGVHGLWPNYNDGSYPSNCDPDSPFNRSKIADLGSRLEDNWPTLACPSGDGFQFWGHEWDKHGTCSESVLDQHQYFETGLNFQSQINLLQVLKDGGIEPDGSFYSLQSITDAVQQGTGYRPGIECNVDEGGNSQLYQVYICVDSSGKNLRACPKFPRSKCSSRIEFPSF